MDFWDCSLERIHAPAANRASKVVNLVIIMSPVGVIADVVHEDAVDIVVGVEVGDRDLGERIAGVVGGDGYRVTVVVGLGDDRGVFGAEDDGRGERRGGGGDEGEGAGGGADLGGDAVLHLGYFLSLVGTSLSPLGLS